MDLKQVIRNDQKVTTQYTTERKNNIDLNPSEMLSRQVITFSIFAQVLTKASKLMHCFDFETFIKLLLFFFNKSSINGGFPLNFTIYSCWNEGITEYTQ